ncbi:MAG: hypothetical protein MUE52_05395 [Tabrizicola sp.]|jgi:hypothetical protein|nr:hypothetical protein [Tabrizicola sp.]
MNATRKSAQKVQHAVTDAADQVADGLQSGGQPVADGADQAATAVQQGIRKTTDAAAEAGDKVHALAAESRSRVTDALRVAKDTAQDAQSAIVAGTASTLATVRDAAIEKADAARESLSDVGDRIAETLQRSSRDGSDDALKSRVMTTVAQGLTKASSTLRQRSVADLTDDVKTLAKRHPGAFMVAAAVAGFAAARFVRASSRRRMARDLDDRSQGPLA